MKKMTLGLSALLIGVTMMTQSCKNSTEQTSNPFLVEYTTPHGTAPFHLIEVAHYEPAMMQGIEAENQEIEDIINNPEAPTFANTIVPYANSGSLLNNVLSVFYNLMEADTNDELQEIAEKMSPVLTEHSNNISLNPELFQRVKVVYENQKNDPALTEEDRELLEKIYIGFVRSGANLSEAEKETYREYSKELSALRLKFAQNALKENNAFELHITDSAQLAGLPPTSVDGAAEMAKERGKEGWVFTLAAPSYSPFMTYCADRELRRQMYMAYNTQCSKGDSLDNKETVKRIVALRRQMAGLLGYETHAEYVLEQRMAENSQNVYNLLDQLVEAYMPVARKEAAEVEAFARQTEGADFQLQSWDWSYYSDKLRKAKYDMDAELLRPYFELSKVQEGIFGLATRLYGITFQENKDIPVYHPDVKAYDVLDEDGSFLAVLYTDYHPRASKQSGAWMTAFKDQWKEADGTNSRPHVSITMNFTKPTADRPALLTMGEVETFLHEFGHAIHGMMANTTYRAMSGTSVFRDFVELPSQIMENWASEKEFLHTFARHYQTGELIPDELVERMKAAQNFNVAYSCIGQVRYGMLDMAWYTLTEDFQGDVEKFEKDVWAKLQVLPAVPGTCMSVMFSHIMDGGYSAGYYGYKWAEVLDADAFSVFKERGLFSREAGEEFRRKILEKGGTIHPMTLYKDFRGQEPSIDALLRRNGIEPTTRVKSRRG
ncbi:MAG: M3 family metallopeptidase [Bacteroidaceae bacterium]|nr:M3 family metallopeptidase [Bacteroidaceae bacterium]